VAEWEVGRVLVDKAMKRLYFARLDWAAETCAIALPKASFEGNSLEDWMADRALMKSTMIMRRDHRYNVSSTKFSRLSAQYSIVSIPEAYRGELTS
jgi:hypothetical protein